MSVLPLCYWLEDFRNWSVEVSFDLLVKLQWKPDFTIWGRDRKIISLNRDISNSRFNDLEAKQLKNRCIGYG